jgi:MscS family membrane protein
MTDFIVQLFESELAWFAKSLLVFVVTGLVDVLWRKYVTRVIESCSPERVYWRGLWFSIRKPIDIAIWLTGIFFIGYFTLSHFEQLNSLETVLKKNNVFILLIALWVIARFIRFAEAESAERIEDGKDLKIDKTSVHAMARLARLVLSLVALLMILQAFGVNISTLLALGGVGGLAIGFAAKDMLANFFGGLVIFLDRPFTIGDWVCSPDRKIEGTVEHIGWRQTRIRTFDKRPLYIPNSIFTSIIVENPSRMINRRIYETISLRYQDAGVIGEVISSIKLMLQAHPDIDTEQTMIVNLNKFGSYSLDFFVYTFTKTTNWVEFHRIKQDVMLKIISIAHKHGADFAYPTQAILHKQSEGIDQPFNLN